MSEVFKFKVQGQEGAIPKIGLGTVSLNGERGVESITSAINKGYRMIDTALLYKNQEAVGSAIKQSCIPRDEIWITSKVGFFPPNASSKLWMFDEHNLKGDEAATLDLCLKQLDLSYVDLLLIHNPTTSDAEYNASSLPHFFELFGKQGSDLAIKPAQLADGEDMRSAIINYKRGKLAEYLSASKSSPDALTPYDVRKNSWLTMEQLLKEGKCRYIGVSNYPAELLLEMSSYATVMPAVNQLEYHPSYASPELKKVAAELGVVLTAYGTGSSCSIENRPEIVDIANKHGKTYMQVVLRWTIQNGVVAIPRTKDPVHMAENLDIFDFSLTDAEMQSIDALNIDYPYYWDPVPTMMTIERK